MPKQAQEERIQSLEDTVRKLQRGVIVLGLGIVAIFGLAAKRTDTTIQAKQFLVVDNGNRIRARLDLSESGTPALIMYHANGTEAMEIGLSNELPSIVQYDRQGRRRFDAGLDPAGNPSILMTGKSAKTAIIVRSANGERTMIAP
jgi:hypothetical protein